jgi:2-phospho-L-lactate guanylyltransferase
VPTVVVPFRADGKSRLPAAIRNDLARAMLADVVAAACEIGRVLVVTDEQAAVPEAAETIGDPGRGQGAAVAAALSFVEGSVLVVNADVPCATQDALRRLAAAGAALVAAADGTTNALSLPEPGRFASLYGPGSAARFAAAGLTAVVVPELAADVDTLDDLAHLPPTVGRHTRLVTDRHKALIHAVR